MSWLIALVGIVLLSVLVDILLPKGQTNKFIKGIFAILVIFVIITPIVKLKNDGYKFPELFDDYQIAADENFIATVKQRQKAELEQTIINTLQKNGIEVQKVVLIYDGDNINNIADCKVQTAQINKTSTIKTIISGILSIEQEYILVYE